jgi:hypothetical protein
LPSHIFWDHYLINREAARYLMFSLFFTLN